MKYTYQNRRIVSSCFSSSVVSVRGKRLSGARRMLDQSSWGRAISQPILPNFPEGSQQRATTESHPSYYLRRGEDCGNRYNYVNATTTRRERMPLSTHDVRQSLLAHD